MTTRPDAPAGAWQPCPGPWATPGIGTVSLHEPTGSVSTAGIQPHHDQGPITAGAARLLESLTPEPLLPGHPGAAGQRTTADAEHALAAHGWQVITIAEAADLLRAAGYVLGDNRAAGHALYRSDTHNAATVWRHHHHTRTAFIAPVNRPQPDPDLIRRHIAVEGAVHALYTAGREAEDAHGFLTAGLTRQHQDGHHRITADQTTALLTALAAATTAVHTTARDIARLMAAGPATTPRHIDGHNPLAAGAIARQAIITAVADLHVANDVIASALHSAKNLTNRPSP